ncbi:MAG: hypothetical protein D9V45_12920 [Chloroflexi bacterium]|nr:MAG: hypothetical protein D9V45_12920 [Chloroflexota bacterium]
MRIYVPPEKQVIYEREESARQLAEIIDDWPRLTNWQKYQLTIYAWWHSNEKSFGKWVIRFFKLTYIYLTNK